MIFDYFSYDEVTAPFYTPPKNIARIQFATSYD
jgi:hypothetical protein